MIQSIRPTENIRHEKAFLVNWFKFDKFDTFDTFNTRLTFLNVIQIKTQYFSLRTKHDLSKGGISTKFVSLKLKKEFGIVRYPSSKEAAQDEFAEACSVSNGIDCQSK